MVVAFVWAEALESRVRVGVSQSVGCGVRVDNMRSLRDWAIV
jgi:hypothetical protein